MCSDSKALCWEVLDELHRVRLKECIVFPANSMCSAGNYGDEAINDDKTY